MKYLCLGRYLPCCFMVLFRIDKSLIIKSRKYLEHFYSGWGKSTSKNQIKSLRYTLNIYISNCIQYMTKYSQPNRIITLAFQESSESCCSPPATSRDNQHCEHDRSTSRSVYLGVCPMVLHNSLSHLIPGPLRRRPLLLPQWRGNLVLKKKECKSVQLSAFYHYNDLYYAH